MKLFKNVLHNLLTVFFLSVYYSLWAQKLEVSLSARQVQVGQMFEVRFTANGNISSFSPPSFKDFEVVGGPNQSSSIQFINGIISQSQSISYYLYARKEGKYTIGPATAIVDGQKVSSSSVVMDVMGGNATQHQPSNNQAASANQQEASEQKIETGGKEYFVRTILSKNKCMKGEYVIVSQKIYSKHPIVSIEKFDPPSYEGVWSQTLQTTSGNQLQNEVLNGEQYYSFEVYRHQVSPTKTGKITFKPVDGVIIIRKAYQGKPRNIWEQFFGTGGYQDVRVTVKSSPVELMVMDLPTAGRPENFSGAIGEFQMKSEISRKELKQNEGLNLKITISGKGNLQTVESPRPELPEGFELYDPKINEYASSKIFDFLIIPRTEGRFTIKVPEFSYFSLDKKQYITIPSFEYEVNVLPGNGSGGAVVYQSQQLQQDIPKADEDIRYIKKYPFPIGKEVKAFTGSTLYWLVYGFPWLGLASLMFLLYRRKQNRLNMEEFMFRRASKSAYKMLEMAAKDKSGSQAEKFYFYVIQGMQHYLCAKLKIGLSDFQSDKVYEKLIKNGVTVSTAKKWVELYEAAEQYRYAPGIASSDRNTFLNEVKEVLNKTEKEFKA
jgi:hypothetical protein